MISNHNNEGNDPAGVEDQARRWLEHVAQIEKHIDDYIVYYTGYALNPIDTISKLATIQKITDSLREAQGSPIQDDRTYWNAAEAKLWEPYREHIRQVAESMWEAAGQSPGGVTSNFAMAAKRYLAGLMGLAKGLGATPDGLDTTLRILKMEFPPAEYVHRVQDLAEAMSRRSKQVVGASADDYWLSAEVHVSAMLIGATNAVRNSSDYQTAISYLKRISTLPREEYLCRIEVDAYYRWQSAGQPWGMTLTYWLESERAMLARIRAGDGESPPTLPSAVLAAS
ncbi:MAG TPA: DUF2934 domain-containing protein [Kineosporiaceae bacterium]|nr:DUF2934 domain-containing protein [Kineosporiaceae bacterium]